MTVNSALITGAGNIEIDTKTPQTKIVINFNLDNLDFDSLWLNDAFYASKDPNSNDLPSNDQLQTINLATNSLPNNQNSDLDIKARITIKNAKYLGAKINDFDLSASSFDQYSVLINPITFNIMDSTAKITGVLKNESDLKFIGHIEVKGNKLQDLFTNVKIDSENLRYDNLKNYNLQSGLVILPNLTILNNLSFKLDDKNEFLGNIKIDSSKKINNIISDFKVNEFNVDDYFLISGQNSYLSSGLLIKKIFWLNNITSTHKVNLSFDKLIYKNELFENQSVNMEFGQGYLSINNLLLKSNDTDLTANLDLDIRGSTPLITINLAADKFHYQTTQLNQQPPNVAAGAPVSAPNNQNNFTDQFFALPSLTGVDGKINLKIANLTLDQLTAKNLKIIGEIKDGNIDFSDFNAEMLGGKIEFKGSAIIRSEKLINGNIILSNISLKPLLNGLFGLNNIDGVSNIAASFRSSADNKKDFIRNIDSNLKFSIRSLEVEGYGLNDLVIKLFDPNNNLTELTNPQQILFNQNAKTVFEKATGELNISKTDENKLHVDLSSLAINGLVSGNINLVQKDINLTANIIFLTGTRKKQLPLNIISNLKGEIDNFSQNTNLSQVNQYLQMIYGNQTINNNPGQNVNNVNNPILDKMPATQPSPSNITP